MAENQHIPGPLAATSAVFVTPEDRARGVDPVAVAAELARTTTQAAALGSRGVSVQILQGALPSTAGASLPTQPAAPAPVPVGMPLQAAQPGNVSSWGSPSVQAVARPSAAAMAAHLPAAAQPAATPPAAVVSVAAGPLAETLSRLFAVSRESRAA